MPEDVNPKETLVALGVSQLPKELYVDLLSPAAKELGTNLHTVARAVTVAMAPLRGLIWGFEKVQDWLAAALLRRLATTDPDHIQTPASYLAGPILLQLPFCAAQAQLRDMYANLLASAMNKEAASDVHPAFIQIIQQLTPDEAVLLQAVAERAVRLTFYELVTDYTKYKNKEGSISQQFRKSCDAAGVSQPSLSDTYLDNLLRLKLLTERQWSEGEYRPAGVARHGDYPASVKNSDGRLVELSAFGEAFLKTCVAEGTNEKSGV